MIEIKNKDEIDKIKNSSKIVAEILIEIKRNIFAGMKTIEIDRMAEKLVKKYDAKPAFLGYNGYPASICVSINNEVVHGIPSEDRIIKEGDIVSLDFGVEKDGFFGDAAITVGIGKISDIAKKLLDVTENALYKGIDKARKGNRLYDISATIQEYVEKNGFSVVRDFVGHGIGKKLHEEPMVPNFGEKGTGPYLEAGMTFAIEPMVNEKSYEVFIKQDGWTVVTRDGGLSAHFEHTVLITNKGPEILTKV